MSGTLALLGRAWGIVSSSAMLWKILNNWYFIKESIVEIEKIAKQAVMSKQMPDCDQSKILVKILSGCLEKGLIDFPGIDESQLVNNLQKLEANLVCHARKVDLTKEVVSE